MKNLTQPPQPEFSNTLEWQPALGFSGNSCWTELPGGFYFCRLTIPWELAIKNFLVSLFTHYEFFARVSYLCDDGPPLNTKPLR